MEPELGWVIGLISLLRFTTDRSIRTPPAVNQTKSAWPPLRRRQTACPRRRYNENNEVGTCSAWWKSNNFNQASFRLIMKVVARFEWGVVFIMIL